MRKRLSSKKNNKKDEINYDETQLIPIPIKEPLKETIVLRPNDVGTISGVLPKGNDLIVYPNKNKSLLDDLLSDRLILGSNYDDTQYNYLNSNNNGNWSPKFGSPERFGMNTPSTTRSLSNSVEGSPILSQEFDTTPVFIKDVKSNFIKIPYPASAESENQTLESFTVGNPNSSSSLINMMRDLELNNNEGSLQSKTKKEKTLKKSASTSSIKSTNSTNSARSTNSTKSTRNKNKTKKTASKASKDSISKGKKKNNKTKKGGKRISKKRKTNRIKI